ncbi:hypothetical protein [Limnohabitans sp. Rim28]|uniref:hypothetical protein n=1 Tax=Limnohabitans sp. Rim28 TaxID=1100720 RepID=UPI001056E726|nr:hypothetical protein [Limnohabitans sp. Rim28]
MQEQKQGIAVRLYDNDKYGTTYGKGIWHRALFNGSMDVDGASAAYLTDFLNVNDWGELIKTPLQVEIVNNILNDEQPPTKHQVFSWLQRYNRSTKMKGYVDGFVRYDMSNGEMLVYIKDDIDGYEETWRLNARPCRKGTTNSPSILATNKELQKTW